MMLDWTEMQIAVLPVKSYDDLCRRLQESFSYEFVRRIFSFALPQLADYMHNVLGGDLQQRYTEYAGTLLNNISAIKNAGVEDIPGLINRTASREHLEGFCSISAIAPLDVIRPLKFLIYWLIPMQKYLSGLVGSDLPARQAVNSLSTVGVRTNLDLLQQGCRKTSREALAATSGLSLDLVESMLHRADFSRMPWASKATISNIVGAGYPSLARFTVAEPGEVAANFYRYGESIGKNLKHGNEIKNCHRIARHLPVIVREE